MVTKMKKPHRFAKLSVITDELNQSFPGNKVSKKYVRCIQTNYGINREKKKTINIFAKINTSLAGEGKFGLE